MAKRKYANKTAALIRVPKLKTTISTARLSGQNPPASALKRKLTVGSHPYG